MNWVDSDKGIAAEVHQVAQPPSRNSGHRGVWAVGRETARHQDFPADCQLLDVQSSPGLKFKHINTCVAPYSRARGIKCGRKDAMHA